MWPYIAGDHNSQVKLVSLKELQGGYNRHGCPIPDLKSDKTVFFVLPSQSA